MFKKKINMEILSFKIILIYSQPFTNEMFQLGSFGAIGDLPIFSYKQSS